MDLPNAFLRKRDEPTEAEVTSALGPTARLWKELIEGITADAGGVKQEWQGIYVNKYGWSLRLKKRSRSILFLAPCKGCFRVAFALNDKAVKAAKVAHLPRKVASALASAPRFLEGTGLRLIVHKSGDLAAIRKLAKIKLAS
jgi:hypothetical protein